MEEIQKEVNETFGNESIMTGSEIKSILNEIYFLTNHPRPLLYVP